MKWKPLRVVVEVRVPPGSPFRERDLQFALRTLLEEQLPAFERRFQGYRRDPFTRPVVKSLSRLRSAEIVAERDRKAMQEIFRRTSRGEN